MENYNNKCNGVFDKIRTRCRDCIDRGTCMLLSKLRNDIKEDLSAVNSKKSDSLISKEYIDSLKEILSNKFVITENHYKNLSDKIGLIMDEFEDKISNIEEQLDEILSYAPSSKNDTQNQDVVTDVTVLNQDTNTMLVEKKGLFGKTKWVEEKVEN